MYNTYTGGADLSDQRAVSYARLMRGVISYFKVFFCMWKVCLSNAHILHAKSPNHASIDFRTSVIKALVEGICFRRDAGLPQIPIAIPETRFSHDNFHYLTHHDTRSTHKVHIQPVRTLYTFEPFADLECAQNPASKDSIQCSHYGGSSWKQDKGGLFTQPGEDHGKFKSCYSLSLLQ